MRVTAQILILSLCLPGCASSIPRRPAAAMTPAGDYVQRMPGGKLGSPRRYRAHVPALAGDAPVVIALHGAFSSARGLEKRSGFDSLADDHGFIAIYPDGFGFLGLFRHWNAGHCCRRAAKLGLDHIGYVDAVIDDVLARLPADPTRR